MVGQDAVCVLLLALSMNRGLHENWPVTRKGWPSCLVAVQFIDQTSSRPAGSRYVAELMACRVHSPVWESRRSSQVGQ